MLSLSLCVQAVVQGPLRGVLGRARQSWMSAGKAEEGGRAGIAYRIVAVAVVVQLRQSQSRIQGAGEGRDKVGRGRVVITRRGWVVRRIYQECGQRHNGEGPRMR